MMIVAATPLSPMLMVFAVPAAIGLGIVAAEWTLKLRYWRSRRF